MIPISSARTSSVASKSSKEAKDTDHSKGARMLRSKSLDAGQSSRDQCLLATEAPSFLRDLTDECLESLISMFGAKRLIRKLSADIAQRETDVADLTSFANTREQILKYMLIECGYSNTNIERALAQYSHSAKEMDRETARNKADFSQEIENNGSKNGKNDQVRDETATTVAHKCTSQNLLAADMPSKGGVSLKAADGKLHLSNLEDTRRNYIADSSTKSKRPSNAEVELNDTLKEVSTEADSARKSNWLSSLFRLTAGRILGESPAKTNNVHEEPENDAYTEFQNNFSSFDFGRAASPSEGLKKRKGSIASIKSASANQLKLGSYVEPVELEHIVGQKDQPLSMSKPSFSARIDKYGFIYDHDNYPFRQQESSKELNYSLASKKTSAIGKLDKCGSASRGSRALSVNDTHEQNLNEITPFWPHRLTLDMHNLMLEGSRNGNESIRHQMEKTDYSHPNRSIKSPYLTLMRRMSSPPQFMDMGNKNDEDAETLRIKSFPLTLTQREEATTALSKSVLQQNDPRLFGNSTMLDTMVENTDVVEEEAYDNTLMFTEESARSKLLLYLDQEENEDKKEEKWSNFIRKLKHKRAELAARSGNFKFDEIDGIPVLIGIASLGNLDASCGTTFYRDFRRLVIAGIPCESRAKVWSELLGLDSTIRRPGYYDELLRSTEDYDKKIIAQIDMDINRTLPDNVYFSADGAGRARLRNILIAYSRHDPEIGYCQGINIIAAILLLKFPTEEEVFYGLMSIIEQKLPKRYYTPDLLSSRVDQSVLKHLMASSMPRLGHYLEELGVQLEAITFGWFLSIFTNCLPPRVSLHYMFFFTIHKTNQTDIIQSVRSLFLRRRCDIVSHCFSYAKAVGR